MDKMGDITKDIRQQVADYVKANGRFTSRRDVIKGMTENPSSEIRSWGLTKTQVEELVRDTLWPGEKRKGKVLYSLSKQGDVYKTIDDALKGWDDPSVSYRVVSGGYGSDNKYKIEKVAYDGRSRDTVTIAKNVPRKWAEEYVMHQIDSSLPKPSKVVGRDKLEVTGKAILTSDIGDILKYGKSGKGMVDVTDRPVFVFKGQDEGVIADGFLLIENRKAADKVLGAIEKRMDRQVGAMDAEQKKAYRKEAKFPDYKNLYPKEYTNVWKPLGAQYADGIHRLFFTNGKGEFGSVDLDKFAFIIENLPDGKLTAIKSGDTAAGGVWGNTEKFLTSPLTFFVDNKPVALLMPLLVPPSSIPLPIKESVGTIKVPEGAVLATVIENPPMTFADVYKNTLKRKDTNKKSAIFTAVQEVLGGYRDMDDAKEDAVELRKTGGRRYSPWGYEIGPETIERAISVKSKLHPSGFTASVADDYLKDIRQRVQEYYDRGYTRDIPKGGISAELVRHEYAPVGGNRDWWLGQVKQIIDDEEKVVAQVSKLLGLDELQAIHDSRSSRSRESDERQSNADTIEPDDPRVEQWLKDQGRADVVGIDTPRKGKGKKVVRKATRTGKTPTQVRGLRR